MTESPHLGVVYASASNLDAIDFTALALADAAGLATRNLAIVDASDPASLDPSIRGFDPRMAVPGCSFARSPDGSVRQVVRPLLEHGVFDTVTSARMPGRFEWLLEQATQRHAADKRHSLASAFLSEAFAFLGCTQTRVVTRTRRNLAKHQRKRVLSLLERALVERIGPTSHDFVQGGAIVVDDASAMIRVSATNDGQLLFGGNQSARATVSSSILQNSVGFELRGPLDSLVLGMRSRWIAAHVPWYLKLEDDGPRTVGPASIELAHSLFFRWPEGRLPAGAVSFSGVLLDEYEDDGVRAYLQSELGSSALWLPGAVRWVSAGIGQSRERWAWSQAPAKRFTDDVRRGRVQRPPPSPLLRLVRMAIQVEVAARDANADASTASKRSAPETVQFLIDEAAAHIDEWSGRLIRWRLPEEFGAADGLELVDLRRRIGALPVDDNVALRLAGVRAILWRVVECAVRAVMIVGDTKLRASVPLLAMVGGPHVVRQAALLHTPSLSERASRIQAPSVI